MLRNSTEDLSTTEMRGRQLCLLIYSPYSLIIYRVFGTSFLPRAASRFPLSNETETEANTTKANSAKCCRTQSGHLNFDIYIAKTQTPTVWLRNFPSWFCERVCIHDSLVTRRVTVVRKDTQKCPKRWRLVITISRVSHPKGYRCQKRYSKMLATHQKIAFLGKRLT